MKRLALILGASALLVLAGCGGGPKAEDTPAPVEAQEPSVEEETGGGVEAASGGYVFDAGGTEIVIDAEAAPVLAALGEPDSYYEAASCAFEGLDKYYTYASYEVDTYPDEAGVERISYVHLRDDLVETEEGVCIGDSREKVESVYGTGETDGTSEIYEKGGMRLMFVYEDDAVISIQYQTKVLDGTVPD